MTNSKTTQGSQDKIDAIHCPKWCEKTTEGQLYWKLICAAIRDDVQTILKNLKEHPDCARLEYWYTPPIHFAVREGNLAATRVLWEAYQYEEVTRLIVMAEDRGHTGVAETLRDAIGIKSSDSDLRLFKAVESGDINEISRLLTEYPEISQQRDVKGQTALHLAVILNDRSVVEALVRSGQPLDRTDHQGFRPVHYACWRSPYWQPMEDGNNLLDQLLSAGAADSPTLAANRGDLDALHKFTEHDANSVNDGDTLNKRPLSAAIQQGHTEIVRFLLDHGAIPYLPEGRCCPFGSALMEASVSNQVEVASWLLEAGADPNGYIDSSGTPTIRAVSDAMRGLLYAYGGHAENAWGLAQRGQLGALAAILRYCNDPFSNEEEEFLTTPYTAIISGWKRCADQDESTKAHEAMLEMFLRRKHPMPKVLTACKTYLYHAEHMTRRLLEHGLDPNLPDWLGRTPLHDICSRNREQSAVNLINMFLQHGADLEVVDEEDRSTPLGIAAREGDIRLVKLLLRNGADVNGCGADWARPMAWAMRRGHHQVVEILLTHGAT